MVGAEAEKPSVSAQPADQKRQGNVSGSAGGAVTEVHVANLRGAEQDFVTLAIQAPMDGQLHEVEFDFNLGHDSPRQVQFVSPPRC